METMKAVRIYSYGGPKTLVYEDAPLPQAGVEQVLVHVHAAGVNPIDWKIREGWLKGMFDYTMPLILGTDISGTVAAVGSGVTGFQAGQDVYGVADMTLSGAYAEYALARAEAIAPKPRTLNYVQASSVPIVAMTAWQALFEVGGLKSGQSVLVHAAAGGVGSFAVQFAKVRGLHVIGTASAQNLSFVRELGADEVIDYSTTAFEQVVNQVDMVLDTVGGDTQARSWSVLKPGGILVATASPPDSRIAQEWGVRSAMMVVQPKASLLTEIAALLDSGQVKTTVSQVLPLSEARLAHELSQNGHTRGKLVLQVV